MEITCKSKFQSEITLRQGSLHIVGSFELIHKMNELKEKYGSNPVKWPELEKIKSADELLINEFILKCQSRFQLAYEHAELCHCRMVPAERVYDAIKQGCRTVNDIGRTTLAGTGCGSCRPDIEKLLKQFQFS
ncbi:MAG: hypothetical protein A2622_10645 [Bdellovibrionales bacterium RIFCSPHIGHO2_01_FULL_40_29]|nr:MAG: hypothetical protein A2622_10645 [Bdellovibrionales bacterium RIFCSPHIGHO2_01_FULL_40_29]OFZ34417.1 MAG: hypothetical protein A3D17_00910 [Bdellovibrionales bacterium RIFCSPHIGHO2_02_FULL_40_15]